MIEIYNIVCLKLSYKATQSFRRSTSKWLVISLLSCIVVGLMLKQEQLFVVIVNQCSITLTMETVPWRLTKSSFHTLVSVYFNKVKQLIQDLLSLWLAFTSLRKNVDKLPNDLPPKINKVRLQPSHTSHVLLSNCRYRVSEVQRYTGLSPSESSIRFYILFSYFHTSF